MLRILAIQQFLQFASFRLVILIQAFGWDKIAGRLAASDGQRTVSGTEKARVFRNEATITRLHPDVGGQPCTGWSHQSGRCRTHVRIDHAAIRRLTPQDLGNPGGMIGVFRVHGADDGQLMHLLGATRHQFADPDSWHGR